MLSFEKNVGNMNYYLGKQFINGKCMKCFRCLITKFSLSPGKWNTITNTSPRKYIWCITGDTVILQQKAVFIMNLKEGCIEAFYFPYGAFENSHHLRAYLSVALRRPQTYQSFSPNLFLNMACRQISCCPIWNFFFLIKSSLGHVFQFQF